MSLVLIPVLVRAKRANGTAVAGARVRAVLTVSETDGGLVVPSAIEGVTDANGDVTLNLWPNARGVNGSQYRVIIDGAQLYFSGLITLPDVPSTAWPVLLETVISQPPFPLKSAAELAQISAQEDALRAEAAANQAENLLDEQLVAATAQAAIATAQANAASVARNEAAASEASALQHKNAAGTSASEAAASAAAASQIVLGVASGHPSIRPTLNLDFANDKALDPRITFARASNATYYDDKGVMKTAAAGVARFDHDPLTGECLGLLIEEQRTNLLIYSEQFDNTAWGKYGVGTGVVPVVTANYGAAPDGSTTADRIQFDRGASATDVDYSIINQNIATSSGTRAKSIFLKSNTGSNQQVLFYDGYEAVGVVVTVTPVWQRFEIGNGSAATESGIVIGCRGTAGSFYTGGDQVLDILVWGAQIEAGSYATSYIKTASAQVTRAADESAMTGVNFSSWYRADEGTVYAEVNYTAPNAVVMFTDGTDSNRVRLGANIQNANATQIDFAVQVSGTVVSDTVLGGVTVNTQQKMAGAYKTNDCNAALNGTVGATDTSAALPTVNSLFLGKASNSAAYMAGRISKIAYYPKRLSNSELQALTA